MKFDLSMISVLLATIAPALALFLAITWDRRQRNHTEKPPQSEKLLRPPGYSLSIRLDETFDLAIQRILTASVLSAISSAGVIALASLLGIHAPASYVVPCLLVVAPFVAGAVWTALRAFHLFKEAQKIRLGLRGEQAVAEVLNEAGVSGFRTFHDLQTDKVGNIDHITVGTRGVYLIETKARRKRAGTTGQPAHEVTYDGDALQFPRGRDVQTVEQAKRNAAWLSNYLRDATGEPVEVFPLVVLPGWFVRITARGNFRVSVLSANYLPGFLSRQGERIPAAQVKRIIFALDNKCRDVEF